LPFNLAWRANPLFFAACSCRSAKSWFILTLFNWSWWASILLRTFSVWSVWNLFQLLSS
jgi:hypothetical protein